MKRPKKKVAKVTEVFHDMIGPNGIRVIDPRDRVHLECGHYIDEKKARFHGHTRRCSVCQTKKVPA